MNVKTNVMTFGVMVAQFFHIHLHMLDFFP